MSAGRARGEDGDHVVRTYRARARLYDASSRLYYLIGFRERAYRRRGVQALRLRAGSTVIDIGCGTGLNFPLIEPEIGREGRIVGVDLSDAMLARARRRADENGWGNVSLVRTDATEFAFPQPVEAILSTFALELMPDAGSVIARGCEALSPGGRWAVVDTKPPHGAPRWMTRAWLEAVRPFGVTEELLARRPWETVRAEMRARLSDFSWSEFFFGFAYLAAGTRVAERERAQPG